MKKIIIALLLVIFTLSGCNSGSSTPAPKTEKSPSISQSEAPEKAAEPAIRPEFTKSSYPKVDGSTATIPLSEAFASNLLGMSKQEAKKFIKHNTTHNAYVNLINGAADIIFVTEPSKEELALAKESNIELEVVPVVMEGFVFLVNTNNSVDTLTVKQIQDIYQGKITNWKQVGGKDNEILAYQREPNSGSQTLMEQTVMKGLKMTESPKKVVIGMEGLIESVASFENSEKSLGYSVFYYAKTMFTKDTIKLLAVDGVKPENSTISSGKYPFTSSYYAVLKKSDDKSKSTRKLLEWVLGNEGQKVAEEAGYVPLGKR